MKNDIIILIAYLLIVTGLIQWIIYYTHKSIQAIREAKEAYKEYKKAEKACEDYMKDLDANHKICYTYSTTEIKCKHEYEQVDKEMYITDDGLIAKKLIDICQKCGKRRER